jgi:hypothetical protein
MTGFSNTSLALLGAVGALTFSLLSTKTIQYFVGVGFFAIAFLLAYAVSKDLNISMLAGMLSGFFVANFFRWVLDTDIYSAIFLIVIATIGVLLLITILLNLRLKINIPTPGFSGLKGLPNPRVGLSQLKQAINYLK